MAEGNLHTYLLFTWITVFFFNLAIPAGKVAVSAYLIEMNGQGSESPPPRFFYIKRKKVLTPMIAVLD